MDGGVGGWMGRWMTGQMDGVGGRSLHLLMVTWNNCYHIGVSVFPLSLRAKEDTDLVLLLSIPCTKDTCHRSSFNLWGEKRTKQKQLKKKTHLHIDSCEEKTES